MRIGWSTALIAGVITLFSLFMMYEYLMLDSIRNTNAFILGVVTVIVSLMASFAVFGFIYAYYKNNIKVFSISLIFKMVSLIALNIFLVFFMVNIVYFTLFFAFPD